jgi:ATP/maltotriose-dependent transcriptional regulator MalT
VSLDPGRTWFRYHHLFGDLLRLELRRRLPEQVLVLYRRAAEWFAQHGQVVEAIRHTQAAGDWHDAARLLADHAFSLTLDGQVQTIQALVRAFPPGTDDPELALVRAGGDLVQGHLDEASAHLAVAEAYAEAAPPDRRRRLRIAVASLKLSLARRRGHLAGVLEQVRLLNAPVTGQRDEDIALGNDLRAVALMNLGSVEAWSLALPDAERHLQEGAALAKDIGRTLPRGQLPGTARVRVEDSPFRHDPGALPRGDNSRRAIRLGNRNGDRARTADAGRLDDLHRRLTCIGRVLQAECPGRHRTGHRVPHGGGAHLLAGLAHRELGDQRAANQAAERALALAEPDRPVLPLLMTDSRELLEDLPRHQTAHAALLADILDVHVGGTGGGEPPCRGAPGGRPRRATEELSPGELRVLRYLPTNLSRLEIARDLSVSPNTVSTHIRSIYTKLDVRDRSSAVQRARELRLLAAGRTR